MNHKEWRTEELKRAGWFDKDGFYEDAVGHDVEALFEVFEKQGHSGMSAELISFIFKRLADWKPLTPLTGEDDEWNEGYVDHNGDTILQNKRCSAVFKNVTTGECKYLDGKIFSDNGGKTWYTCRESQVPVEFPYTVPEKPERIILKGEE